MHPWLPNQGRIKSIFQKLGIKDYIELFNNIPEKILLKEPIPLGIPEGLQPWEIEREIKKLIGKNPYIPLNRIFAGGPIAPHYVHPVVQYIISRGEFLTSYTPYQPEINQGTLQALYEFQSLIAELFGVEVVNAGMYDGATALGEAVFLAYRVKKKKNVLVPENLFHRYKNVLKTYLLGPEMNIVEYKINDKGHPDIHDIEEKLEKNEASAVILEQPTSNGIIVDNLNELIETIKTKKSLAITLVEPTLMSLITPPGEQGSDIVVSEGQPLGLPLYGGGNLLGIIGVKWERTLIRNMPGRIIGETLDSNGKTGYMMILQTREQHIRREKATSNITTNTALNAIAAAIHISLLGEKGLRRLASIIYTNTKKLQTILQDLGFKIIYEKSKHYKNILYQIKSDSENLLYNAINHGIIPYTIIKNNIVLSCTTEIHTDDDYKALKNILR